MQLIFCTRSGGKLAEGKKLKEKRAEMQFSRALFLAAKFFALLRIVLFRDFSVLGVERWSVHISFYVCDRAAFRYDGSKLHWNNDVQFA